MAKRFAQLQRTLLVAVCVIIALALVLITALLLANQFTETSSKNEILPLTSFVLILTFSGLAFNWCRVPPNFTSEVILKEIYRTGIHLFLTSLLALVAFFFTWFQTRPEVSSPGMTKACLILHWIYMSLSIALFLAAMLRLLVAIVKEPPTE